MLYFLKSMSVKEPHVAYPHISCTIPSTIFPAFCGSSNDCRLEAESCSWSSESSEGSWWIQGMMGSIVKRVLSRHLGVKPQNIFHCTIMPCYDRKLEAAREDLRIPGLPASPSLHHLHFDGKLQGTLNINDCSLCSRKLSPSLFLFHRVLNGPLWHGSCAPLRHTVEGLALSAGHRSGLASIAHVPMLKLGYYICKHQHVGERLPASVPLHGLLNGQALRASAWGLPGFSCTTVCISHIATEGLWLPLLAALGGTQR